MAVGIKEVLIVDAEENFLLSIVEGFNVYKKYFNLRTAPNGAEAVKILKSSIIDLVVTDLSMPVMDGFELVAYMSRNYPKIPVIITTAYGTPKIEEIFSKMGVIRYFDKPLDLNEFTNSIFDGLGINPVKADSSQAKIEKSSDQIIRGGKKGSVINLAFYRFKKSAAQGNAEAQFYLAKMYLDGDGVDKDESEALKWFRKAAEQGHAGAKENIRKLEQ